jgi:hypothetical protein
MKPRPEPGDILKMNAAAVLPVSNCSHHHVLRNHKFISTIREGKRKSKSDNITVRKMAPEQKQTY